MLAGRVSMSLPSADLAPPSPVSVPALITPNGGGDPFWQFPASWTPAETAEFLAAMGELSTEDERLADVREEERTEAESPAAVIAATRAAVVARRLERMTIERDRAEDVIYADLVKEYGGDHRVGRIRTREGSIMLRPLTGPETDALALRCANPQLSEIDKVKLHKDTTIASVRHPSRVKLDEILGQYVSLWDRIYEARDALSSGLAEDAKKNG